MARYERSYNGERRTVKRTVQFTPTEAAALAAAATEQGAATISDFAREMIFSRSAARPSGGFSKAEIVALKRELEISQHANNAIGNLLNQLARHANTTGELGRQRLETLDEALLHVRRATDLYIAALSRVLAL